MGKAKWLMGGLGFVLGGPIGALVGVLIGSLFDQPMAALNSGEGEGQPNYTNSSRTRTRATHDDIKVSLLVLIACVMKADGHVRKSELDVVKRFLVRNYGEQGALEALQMLKDLLNKEIDHAAVANQMADYINYSTRLALLHFLLELANADGHFAEAEQQIIYQIGIEMRLSAADIRSHFALYQQPTNPNWAYEALEIDPTASDEEVKKAYRRVAMKYHPDKVASAGEEIKQKATEKFQKIQEAYETIKKQRGLS